MKYLPHYDLIPTVYHEPIWFVGLPGNSDLMHIHRQWAQCDCCGADMIIIMIIVEEIR